MLIQDIKIFLASSEELKKERYKFPEIVLTLNNEYRSKGYYFDLVKWEYLDSSMGKDRKQDEYNRELRTCDIVFVVFWHIFGDYTNEEFQMALKGLREKDLPNMLVVMFKNDDDPIDEKLEEFKNGLKAEDKLEILNFSTEEEFSSLVKSMITSYVKTLQMVKK